MQTFPYPSGQLPHAPGMTLVAETIKPIRQIPNPVPVNESRTCFVSMVPADEGGYHAAYREFTPFDPKRFRSDIFGASIRYQKYDADFNLVGESHLLRERAEDPRSFIWRGRPWCVALDETSRGFANYHNILIDLLIGRVHNLESDLMYQGKNWMPLVHDDRLLFIRSIDPLCIVECDPSDWHCSTLIAPSHNHIGQYRGGAAAFVRDGMIQGYGHRTTSLTAHTPYRFEIDLRSPGGPAIKLVDLHPIGFEDTIMDPTCILPDGRMLMACSKLSWDQPEVLVPTFLCETTR